MKCTHDFMPATRDGRYFRFGVREFGMSAICNGLYGVWPRGLMAFGLGADLLLYNPAVVHK